jgi:hypothetical protein
VLSGFPGVSVVSRRAGVAYAGKDVDPAEAGRELGVDYVVEGSVQKKGGGLRINAQLIDAETNRHVWAEAYEGGDPAALQDEAVLKMAVALPGLSGQIRNEYRRIAGKPAAELSEYEYYLRGDELMSRFEGIEEHERAGKIFEEALAKFPDSGLLRTALAWYHFWRPWQFDTGGAADYKRAGELAREALAGENLAPFVEWAARMLLSYINWSEGDFGRAVANAEAAVALAPYDAGTLSFASRVQIVAGNPGRAIEWLKESSRRDPSIWRNTRLLAWAYYHAGENEKSIEAARRHIDLTREWPYDAVYYIAASSVRLGRMEEARAAVEKLLEINPGGATQASEREWNAQWPYKNQAFFERELTDLAQAGLPEK